MKKTFLILTGLSFCMIAFAHQTVTVVYEQPGIVSCAFGIVSSACHFIGAVLEPKTYVTTQICHGTTLTTIPATPAIPTVQTIPAPVVPVVQTVPATAVPVVQTTPAAIVTNPVVVSPATPMVPVKISSITPDYTVINGIPHRLMTRYRNGRYEYYYKPVSH